MRWWFFGLCLLFWPAALFSEENPPSVPIQYLAMDGLYWNNLKIQAYADATLVYTSGFVNGYDYALSLLKTFCVSDPKVSPEFLATLDTLAFPPQRAKSEVKLLVDKFYTLPENKPLPVFVAFTYARYVQQGLSPAFCQAYVEEMRRVYKNR